MKLYTEEQVNTMLSRARLHNQDDTEMFTNEYLLSQETPIELPSDEEIEEDMKGQSGEYACGWEDAFNWMKEQILNQNK